VTGGKRDDDDVTFCTRDPGQEKVRSEEINNIKLFMSPFLFGLEGKEKSEC